VLAAVLAVATASVSCSEIKEFTKESGATAGGNARGCPGTAGKALEKLEVSPPGSMAGYDREEFPHWSEAEEFGWRVPDGSCDVRDATLIRDGKT
jgi:hypothetical protein